MEEARTLGLRFAEAARHAESMRSHRADVAADIERLERTQDELLDRLVAESS